jgi:hypothetical protein
MAYMSDRGGRESWLADECADAEAYADYQFEHVVSARAIREAERIVAATERNTGDVEWAHPSYLQPRLSLGWGWSQSAYGAALAEALAAVLPVLDELADRAVEPFVYAEPEWDDDYNLARVIVNAYTRNRATDAAMEAK